MHRLEKEKRRTLSIFCMNTPHSLAAESVTAGTTHLVVEGDRRIAATRTVKYLQAILLGGWVVTADWGEASVREGRWVDELPYEVVGDRARSPDEVSRDEANLSGLMVGMTVDVLGDNGLLLVTEMRREGGTTRWRRSCPHGARPRPSARQGPCRLWPSAFFGPNGYSACSMSLINWRASQPCSLRLNWASMGSN